MIAKEVSETQRVFILAKELGYCHLGIQARPLTFSWIKFDGFEDVLNNFKASYFAGALILNEKRLVGDLDEFLKSDKWDPRAFLELMLAYTDSAETFFQRLTNLLPKHFGMTDMFFLRFSRKLPDERVSLTKEYHIGSGYQPRAHQEREHYCRRWVSTGILTDDNSFPERSGIRIGIQRNQFAESDSHQLILAAGSADPFNLNWRRSVCIGLSLQAKQKRKINFVDSDLIPQKMVGNTCERCPIEDCQERIADPIILRNALAEKAIQAKVEALLRESDKD